MDSEVHCIHAPEFDIIIAGGGMVGLTLACAVAQAGLRIAVIEAEPYTTQLDPSFDGRVAAIALSSKHVFANIGAWSAMAPHAEPIHDIRVSDGNSPFFLHYDHHEVGEAPFGWIIENRYTRKALVDCAAGYDGIEIVSPARVEKFIVESSHAEVTLSDGQTLRARLLIGADGKNSQLRDMAHIPTSGRQYDHGAIVCTIAHELPHHGLAQERFLPAGPFACLPMTGNRSSLVWTEKNEHISTFLQLPPDEFAQEITKRVGSYLGTIRAEGPRFSYPLSVQHAASYVGDRLALIGDAAHGIHPVAGQGVNLGFRDVAVLTEIILRQHSLGLDIAAPDALAHYQRWRRFDNFTMLAVCDILPRLFSTQFTPVKLARGMGLWGVSKLPPLKRFFMRHAMGLSGDLPPLMKEAA